jgi:type I restriction enzyme M protein
MFEQSFKNIDDILHKDAGCGSELDYVEQTVNYATVKFSGDKDEITFEDLEGRRYYFRKLINQLISTASAY